MTEPRNASIQLGSVNRLGDLKADPSEPPRKEAMPNEVVDLMALLKPITKASEELRLRTLTVHALIAVQHKVTSADEMTKSEERIQSLVNESNVTGIAVKALIVQMQKEEKDQKEGSSSSSSNGVMGEIRINLLRKAVTDYRSASTEFHAATGIWKRNRDESQWRHLSHLGLDDTKINEVMLTGQSRQVIKELISGDVEDVIADIEARHKSIIALELSVKQLNDLFVDLATLVDVQSDSLDNIQLHIDRASNHVEGGARELVQAERHQTNARKCGCYVVLMVVIILLMVLVIMKGR
jgi:hypothetical protein